MTNDDDAHLVETQLASEVSFEGKLLEVRSDKVKLPDGGAGTREYRRASRARRSSSPCWPTAGSCSSGSSAIPVRRVDARVPGRQDRRRRNAARHRAARARARRPATRRRRGSRSARSIRRSATRPNSSRCSRPPASRTSASALDEGEFLDVVTDDRGRAPRRPTTAAASPTASRSRRCSRGGGSAADERSCAAVARLVVVHGRVQGVGYRDAAVQAAFTIGVSGWVRNRRDGTRGSLVQGDAGRGRALRRVVPAADRRSRACRTSMRQRGRRRPRAARLFVAVERVMFTSRDVATSEDILPRRVRAAAIQGSPARGRCPWSPGRPAASTNEYAAERAASARTLRANARSDNANARPHALAVEQRGHRHERQRQRDEHAGRVDRDRWREAGSSAPSAARQRGG